MNKKKTSNPSQSIIWISLIAFCFVCCCVAITNNYFSYAYLLLTGADKHPTASPLNNMVVYKINPETILTLLDQEKTDVFITASKNPIYNNIPPLESYNSFIWEQDNYLKIANALHKLVWGDTLKDWHLYSASFVVPNCRDISRINGAGFQFYKRHANWYFDVHNINIDLEYGYVYAGDNNGYYTDQWKDINLDVAIVNLATNALIIAEQNGGRNIRTNLANIESCHIMISISPHVIFDTSWDGWGWEVKYWDGTSFVYGIIIDPYTGKFKILE